MGSDDERVIGLPQSDIIIPCVVWGAIILYYIYQLHRRSQYKNISFDDVSKEGFKHYTSYFYQMRGGWVRKNFLTGQASANTTRDYIRVLLFFAGNSGSVGIILAGYAASTYQEDATPRQVYMTMKLGIAALILLIIFFLFLYSIRYATHFHFLMNVMEANDGVPMNLKVIELVFHKSHFFYAAGLRLYFVLLPMFAWTISSWALLAMSPIYLWLVEDYEDLSFLEPELAIMYKNLAQHQAAFRSQMLAEAGGVDATMAAAAAETFNMSRKSVNAEEAHVNGIQLQVAAKDK